MSLPIRAPPARLLPIILLGLLLSCSLPCPAHAHLGSNSPSENELEAEAKRLREQLVRDPDDLNASISLAVTLQQLNMLRPDGAKRLPEAEQLYRKVLAATSSLPDAQFALMGNLAALLFEDGRARECVEMLDKALGLGQELNLPVSSMAGLYFNRGKALAAMGELTQADLDYLKSSDAAFGNDAASFCKAVAAMRQVPQPLAQRATAVAIQAHFMREMKGDQQLVHPPYLEREHVKPGVPIAAASCASGGCEWVAKMSQADLSWLHFALHKALEQQQAFSEAWQELAVANEVMLPLQHYDIKGEELTFKTIVSVFDSSGDAQWGHQDKTPIFVVGLPRSGSTLVEQILASHTGVYAAGEDTAFAPLMTEVNRGIVEAGGDIAKQAEVIAKYGKKYIDNMRARIPQNKPQPERIVDKMLRNLWLLGYVDRMLPQACLVVVARHPLDAGLSCFQQPFGYHGVSWAWSLDHIAHQERLTWQLLKHWRKVLGKKVLTVHYELLVEFPELIIRKLLEHCGMDWEDQVLEFYKVERSVQTASVTQVRKPLYKTSVARWKRYEQQLQPLLKGVREVVEEYEMELERERRELADALSASTHEEL